MAHDQMAVWSTMEAKPGKAAEVRDFLIEATRRMGEEPGTTEFFSMEIGERQFAIFCTFTDPDALQAHIAGDTAKWVLAKQPELFSAPYDIVQTTILATKAAMRGASS